MIPRVDVVARTFGAKAIINDQENGLVGLFTRSVRAKVVRPASFAHRGVQVVYVRVTKRDYAGGGRRQVRRDRGNDCFRFANLCLLSRGFQNASRRWSTSGCDCCSGNMVIRPSRAGAAGPNICLRIRRLSRPAGQRDEIIRAVCQSIKDRHDYRTPRDAKN